MGDRAQIIIRRAGTDIHFYTHWEGYRLPAILVEGLKAGKPRWSDDSYLARIIFCRMVNANGLHDETGFGISTQYQDSEPSTDLIVNTDTQTVSYLNYEWSFADFVANDCKTWDDL